MLLQLKKKKQLKAFRQLKAYDRAESQTKNQSKSPQPQKDKGHNQHLSFENKSFSNEKAGNLLNGHLKNISNECPQCWRLKKKVKQKQGKYQKVIEQYRKEMQELKSINNKLRSCLQALTEQNIKLNWHIKGLEERLNRIKKIPIHDRAEISCKSLEKQNKYQNHQKNQQLRAQINRRIDKMGLPIQQMTHKINPSACKLHQQQTEKIESESIKQDEIVSILRKQFEKVMGQCEQETSKPKKQSYRKQLATLAQELNTIEERKKLK